MKGISLIILQTLIGNTTVISQQSTAFVTSDYDVVFFNLQSLSYDQSPNTEFYDYYIDDDTKYNKVVGINEQL